MRTKTILIATALAASAMTTTIWAADYDVGSLRVEQPWARATPKGAQVGVGYMTLRNRGSVTDKLTCVSAEVAARCEIHTMAEKDGVLTMRPLPDGLEIKPGETVELKPGSFHVMFVELRTPLERGKPVKGVLKFEKAGPVNIEFEVAPVGAPGPGHGGH